MQGLWLSGFYIFDDVMMFLRALNSLHETAVENVLFLGWSSHGLKYTAAFFLGSDQTHLRAS